MKTKQIEAFKVVMECGSVTGAADQLFLTQPAVTKHIAQLERAVGFALFERTKGRFVPTAEAKVFYHNVRETLAALGDLSVVAEDIKNLNRGHLVIGAVPLLSTGWLPRQCARFLEDKDVVNLTFHTPSSAKIQDWIASGQIDVGVCMTAGDARVNAEVLAELEAVCILPPGHRLTKKDVITPDDFTGQTFIMTAGVEGEGSRQKIESLFRAHDVELHVKFETILASATCSFVAAGAGVSLINAFSAAEFAHLQYEIRPFEPKLCFPIFLLTPRNRPIARLADAFIEKLRVSAKRDLDFHPEFVPRTFRAMLSQSSAVVSGR